MNDDRDPSHSPGFDPDLGHDPDRDLEETLKQYRHAPDPRTKDAVMDTFHRTFAEEPAHAAPARRRPGTERRAVGFWRRSVPLYLAAAAVVAAMGLSFLAGVHTSTRNVGPVVSEPLPGTREAAAPPDIPWSIAESDLL
jgi:hypothetical protein